MYDRRVVDGSCCSEQQFQEEENANISFKDKGLRPGCMRIGELGIFFVKLCIFDLLLPAYLSYLFE